MVPVCFRLYLAAGLAGSTLCSRCAIYERLPPKSGCGGLGPLCDPECKCRPQSDYFTFGSFP